MSQLLHHYTDASSVVGMLTNREVWLSNIQFLNDREEFELGVKIILEELEHKQTELSNVQESADGPYGTVKPKAISDHLKLITDHLHPGNHPTFNARSFLFVFSLSQCEDDLSQWRAYCPPLGGYSVAFNREQLKKVCEQHNEMRLAPCIYDAKDQVRRVRDALDALAQKFVNFVQGRYRQEELSEASYKLHTSSVNELYALAATFKDIAFGGEQEVRLIANGYRNDWLAHRSRGGMVMPYLKVPVPIEAFQSVLIGPCNDQGLARWGLESLKHRAAGREISVGASEIPYRSL